MKEKYEKPLFFAESFSLSQTVAAGCGINAIPRAMHNNANVCAWESWLDVYNATTGILDGLGDNVPDVLFTNSVTNCVVKINSDAEAVIYDACYNNPEGSLKAFSS